MREIKLSAMKRGIEFDHEKYPHMVRYTFRGEVFSRLTVEYKVDYRRLIIKNHLDDTVFLILDEIDTCLEGVLIKSGGLVTVDTVLK